MEGSTPQPYHDDEITLKELILKIQEYFQEVVKNWFLVGLITLPVLGYFLYKHFTHVPTYKAELRFVVEGQGGGGGGLSSLLGTFGIKKGGRTNPYKIIEVGKSSILFEDVIFEEYRDTSLANRLIQEYDLIEKWSESNNEFIDFNFSSDSTTTLLERVALKKLRHLLWGSDESRGITSLNLNEDNGIFSLSTNSTNEILSEQISNRFYERIKLFFEDEIFQNQKKSAEILAFKVDSINSLKNQKIYQLARFEDSNIGLIKKETSSRKSILQQEIQALGMAYAEVMKNYEMTDVNLKDIQPLFMIIDRPQVPLNPSGSSFFKNVLIGGFIGVFLGFFFIVARKVIRDVMSS